MQGVGNGNDYAGEVSGLITSAVGSVPDISAGTTEGGENPDTKVSESNIFSLQVNSNRFSSPVCAGPGISSQCQGWEQFVYNDSPQENNLFMQYWLLHYGAKCPQDWDTDTSTTPNSCYTNSEEKPWPGERLTPSDLTGVTLEGSANANGQDAVVMTTDSGQAGAVGAGSVLGLGSGWKGAEFAVVGDAEGSQAIFSEKTTLTAQLVLNSNSTTAPTCVTEGGQFTGWTAETNNLNLEATPVLSSQSAPTIASRQTNESPPSLPASCATFPIGPPSVAITTPPDGASYNHDAAVKAEYSCSAPAGATLESCTGTVPNGQPIDTANVGSANTFTVTATDNDRQTTTVTHTYRVLPTVEHPTPVVSPWFDAPCTGDAQIEVHESQGRKYRRAYQPQPCTPPDPPVADPLNPPQGWAWLGEPGAAWGYGSNPEYLQLWNELGGWFGPGEGEVDAQLVEKGVNPFYSGVGLASHTGDGVIQNVPTEANKSYNLNLWFNGRPQECPTSYENAAHEQEAVEHIEYVAAIRWGGVQIDETFWLSHNYENGAEIAWTHVHLPSIMATGPLTTLSYETIGVFLNVKGVRAGPLPPQDVLCAPGLDGVLLEPIPRVPWVKALTPGNITFTEATAKGEVNPEGERVGPCVFEYRLAGHGSFEGSTPCDPAPGVGGAPVAVSAVFEQLKQGRKYEFRIVATSPSGTGEATETFQTSHKKVTVDTQAATNVGQMRATLNASVNPEGEEITKCQFELGLKQSAEYEHTYPCEPAVGSGTEPVHVSATAGHLLPAAEYKYRVVATTQAETAEGDVESFQTEEAEPHWYGDEVRLPEGLSVLVTTKGKLALQLEGTTALTCKASGSETIENPLGENEGAGVGKITAFALSGCKEASKGSICTKGEKLGVASDGLPWSSELLAGPPIRDIAKVELTVQCAKGTVRRTFDVLTGSIKPEVTATSALQFAMGSGELSQSLGGKATISGEDKMKGPKKKSHITAELP